MKTKSIALLICLLSTVSASAAKKFEPRFLACVGQVNGSSIGYEYDLSNHRDAKGNINVEDELILDSGYRLNLLAVRSSNPEYSGVIQFSFSEQRGVYRSGSQTCAGGGCPPDGSPKFATILSARGTWEIGTRTNVEGYASPSESVSISFSCNLFENGTDYANWKRGWPIVPR
jgi:hypothetical protein